MKKLIAILLAALMVLGMMTGAMAAEGPEASKTVSIPVEFNAPDGVTRPAAEFELVATAEDHKAELSQNSDVTADDIPEPALANDGKVSFDAGSTGDGAFELTFTAADYNYPGRYLYKYYQKDGSVAGVNYYGEGHIVSVEVLVSNESGTMMINEVKYTIDESATKGGDIVNEYKAGTLKVNKTVSGNLGDKTKYFTFTVTLTGDFVNAVSYGTEGAPSKQDEATWNGNVLTFQLHDGETLTLNNIPEGVEYTVVEAESGQDGYTTTGEVTTATAIDVENATTVTITNTKDENIDTGIVLDSLPYIMIAVAVAAAVVLMSLKKRRVED